MAVCHRPGMCCRGAGGAGALFCTCAVLSTGMLMEASTACNTLHVCSFASPLLACCLACSMVASNPAAATAMRDMMTDPEVCRMLSK